jgi:Cu/Ag efflux pump CusA
MEEAVGGVKGELRARGQPVLDAAINGSVERLRPIMMTMLVASLLRP